jgi:hypothetical protein
MKFLMGFLAGLLVLVVLGVLVAGYFGFVPGVSSLFGSDKAVDLGVDSTQSDYQSARAKGDIDRVDLPESTPPGNSAQFIGQHPASFSLSSAEATALVNEKSWLYFPIRDAQIRFNPDGSAEFSGILELEKLPDFVAALGVSEADFNEVVGRIENFSLLQKNLPFYIKGTGSVTNGNIVYHTDEIKVGRVNIPVDGINEKRGQVISNVEDVIARIPGFSVNNFSISGGQMHFDGTLPDSVRRAVED